MDINVIYDLSFMYLPLNIQKISRSVVYLSCLEEATCVLLEVYCLVKLTGEPH